ncbi:MAG: lytic transglycosylase domain-containing protein, partial [Gammaproteobacteria bacterium]|nr:lytic transglycosylase domain-containing protein [Gammaproteobacteria bacterium]
MSERVRTRLVAIAVLTLAWPLLACAQPAPVADPGSAQPTRSGREIYTRFREGLADPSCDPDNSARWRQHYAVAPLRLAADGNELLPLFGYVVDALREAGLPTEYALIPFVESGYKPGARSASGPAGLWQFIAITARKHNIRISKGYDGRLSPIDSTRAAVRYLKTLHGMFAGDWRLAVMAYNAGEYRIFGALKRSGQVARSADPEKLVGLSGITQAYVRKLQALSCLLDQADDREEWLRALERPVPVLTDLVLPATATSLDAWARRNGLDPAAVRRLNPAFADGRIVARDQRALRVLAPVAAQPAPGAVMPATDSGRSDAVIETAAAAQDTAPTMRTHTVNRGESPWTIARR